MVPLLRWGHELHSEFCVCVVRVRDEWRRRGRVVAFFRRSRTRRGLVVISWDPIVVLGVGLPVLVGCRVPGRELWWLRRVAVFVCIFVGPLVPFVSAGLVPALVRGGVVLW